MVRMRKLPWWLLLVLPGLATIPASPSGGLSYEDASEGLPKKRPGSANDAGWTGVTFADLNLDGWMDLVAIGRKGDGAEAYLGSASGAWTKSNDGILLHFSGRSDVRVGDVDGDGKPDIVESVGKVWLGDATGRWRAGPQNLPADGEDVALGDVDNDGDLDAAVIRHLSGGIRAFLNDGTGRWTDASTGLPKTSGGHKIEFADMNLDGCLDVVVTYYYDGGVWMGDCRGAWTARNAGLTDFQGWGVATGDVNSDGFPDLAFGVFHARTGPEGIRVFLGDGTGNWTARPILLGERPWGGIALEDVDGDGNLDLFAGENGVSEGTARVALLLGDGAGGFIEADAGLPRDVDELEGLGAADVDHDGIFDVGLAHYGVDGVKVWREASAPSSLSARVVSPVGGEEWRSGGLREIRWVTAVPTAHAPGRVDLSYSTRGPSGPWKTIAADLPNTGSHLWKVPAEPTADAHVRVTVRAGAASASGTHAGSFGIDARGGGGPKAIVTVAASPAQLAPLDAESLSASVTSAGFSRLTGTLRVTVARSGAEVHAEERRVDLADGERADLAGSWTSTLADRPGIYVVRARFTGEGQYSDQTWNVSRSAVTTFTLVRPWLEPSRTFAPTVTLGQGTAIVARLTNTGNLPAENVVWREIVPPGYAFQPAPTRVINGVRAHPTTPPTEFASDPAPESVEFNATGKAWVLTYRYARLAPDATVSVRIDLVPLVPGDHAFVSRADYEHSYAHRGGPTKFETRAEFVQRVVPPKVG